MQLSKHSLRLKRLGIATYKEAVIYIHRDSYICKAEGFEAQSRIKIATGTGRYTIATLNIIVSELLQPDEASLSEYAWELIDAKEGESLFLSHPEQIISGSHLLGKIYGKPLKQKEFDGIIRDLVAGKFSDLQIAAFLAATAANNLSREEIFYLTTSMLQIGNRLIWPDTLVVDKHCIGGLPGNKTSMVVVPIVAAFGLTIPKTSSRAITSAAGTADTMETLAPVELDLESMRKVVACEHGCIAWGGLAGLSPADDLLIRIERALNLDSASQLTASILSKKVSAGSTHVLIDIPIGLKSKMQNHEQANSLKYNLQFIGKKLGLSVEIIFTDGIQPVGRGVGPALEARDVVSVLQNDSRAPKDLRERSLQLAARVLEFSPQVASGMGRAIADDILQSGRAWRKFQSICEAQGGMRIPGIAPYTKPFLASDNAKISHIDNRRISRLAKLAGAPNSKTAGVYLHAKVGDTIVKGEPLMTIHAESKGELDYAWSYLEKDKSIIQLLIDH